MTLLLFIFCITFWPWLAWKCVSGFIRGFVGEKLRQKRLREDLALKVKTTTEFKKRYQTQVIDVSTKEI